MKDNIPQITLYMYSLNQEFPAGQGHHTFIKRHSEVLPDVSGNLSSREAVESQIFGSENSTARDWSVQWISNEWITNHTKAAGVGIREESDPLIRSVVRDEKFGAILFDPISDRVFKLNKPGKELFDEIREHYVKREKSLSSFQASDKFSPVDVQNFISFLEGASLWIRQ